MRLGLLGRGVFRAARAVDERHLIVRNDRARGVPEVVRRADRRVRLGDNDLGLVRRELFELAAETVGHDNGLLARLAVPDGASCALPKPSEMPLTMV